MSLGDRNLSGRRLGAYELEALLGEGAFGRVYRARHVDLDVLRAVKVMRPDLTDDRRFRERFLREARTAARLEHPNIVTVYDFAADAEVQYLVMEYVDCLTMAEHLRRRPVAGRLEEPAVQAWIRDVAAALDRAHELGVVHRDLKPANVLIRTRDGRAMLTDFGIAQAVDEPQLTLTGRTMGTYAYMSPEQIKGVSELTGAVDVYAFAAMVVEIATGEPPFGRGIAAVGGHLGSPVPALAYGRGESAERLGAVLAVGLAKEPAERYRSAGELVAAVLQAIAVSSPREQAEAEAAEPAPPEATPEEPVVPADTDLTVSRAWTVRPDAPPAPAQAQAVPASRPGRRLGRLPELLRQRRVALPAAAGAVLLIVAVASAIVALSQQGQPPVVGPTVIHPPPPVQATVGSSLIVADTALTVLTAAPEEPPAGLHLSGQDRLVVVRVKYQAVGPGASIVSPFDWALVDASGRAYGAIVTGIGEPLADGSLERGQTIEGRIGFVVPRTAHGLVLFFSPELGNQLVEVPILQGG